MTQAAATARVRQVGAGDGGAYIDGSSRSRLCGLAAKLAEPGCLNDVSPEFIARLVMRLPGWDPEVQLQMTGAVDGAGADRIASSDARSSQNASSALPQIIEVDLSSTTATGLPLQDAADRILAAIVDALDARDPGVARTLLDAADGMTDAPESASVARLRDALADFVMRSAQTLAREAGLRQWIRSLPPARCDYDFEACQFSEQVEALRSFQPLPRPWAAAWLLAAHISGEVHGRVRESREASGQLAGHGVAADRSVFEFDGNVEQAAAFDRRVRQRIEHVEIMLDHVGQLEMLLRNAPSARRDLARKFLRQALGADVSPKIIDTLAESYMASTAGLKIPVRLPDLDRSYAAGWKKFEHRFSSALSYALSDRMQSGDDRDWLARIGKSTSGIHILLAKIEHTVRARHDGIWQPMSYRMHDHYGSPERVMIRVTNPHTTHYAVVAFDALWKDLLSLGRISANPRFSEDINVVARAAASKWFDEAQVNDYRLHEGFFNFSPEEWVPPAECVAPAERLAAYFAAVLARDGEAKGYERIWQQDARDITYSILTSLIPFYNFAEYVKSGRPAMAAGAFLFDLLTVAPIAGPVAKGVQALKGVVGTVKGVVPLSKLYRQVSQASLKSVPAAQPAHGVVQTAGVGTLSRASLAGLVEDVVESAASREQIERELLNQALERYRVDRPLYSELVVPDEQGVRHIEGRHYVRIDGHDYFMVREADSWRVCFESARWKPCIPVRFDATKKTWQLEHAVGLVGGADRPEAGLSVHLINILDGLVRERNWPTSFAQQIRESLVKRETTLDLSTFPLDEYPEFIAHAPWIESVKLKPADGAEFIINPDRLDGIRHVHLVDGGASAIKMEGLDRHAFLRLDTVLIERCPKLETFEWGSVSVKSMTIRNAPKLRKVDCARASLQTFGIEDADALAALDLSDNHLEQVPDSWFDGNGLANVEVFDLSANRLMSISERIERMSSLRRLNLAENLALSDLPAGLEEPERLRYLDLTCCGFREIPPVISLLDINARVVMTGNPLSDTALQRIYASPGWRSYLDGHPNRQTDGPVIEFVAN